MSKDVTKVFAAGTHCTQAFCKTCHLRSRGCTSYPLVEKGIYKMIQEKIWPRLYGEASKGNTKEWQISVVPQAMDLAEVGGDPDKVYATICTEFGATGAKMQTSTKLVKIGKNIGKSNETTPFEQACNEAQSDWDKKVKKGYRESVDQLQGLTSAATMTATGASNLAQVSEGKPILPMLAHPYEKRSKDIKWPCFAQAKIDGHRAYGHGGKLLSRGGDPVPGFPNMVHLHSEMNRLAELLPDGTWYDGELYTNEIPFEHVSRCIRKAKLVEELEPLIPMVKFFIFDIFDPGRLDLTNQVRMIELEKIIEGANFKHIRLVPVNLVHNEQELRAFHDECVQAGFEGVIVRNLDGQYKIGHRSKDIQKFKDFKDEEFEIIGYKEAMDHTYDEDGNPIEMPTVVWMCKAHNGDQFEVRPKGSLSYRHDLLVNGAQHVGKQLIVRYQNLTEYGIPRFPVGKDFREAGS